MADEPHNASAAAGDDDGGCLRPLAWGILVVVLLASLFTRSGPWLAAEGLLVAAGSILLVVGSSGVSPRGLLMVWALVSFFVLRLHLGAQHTADVVCELRTEAIRFRLPSSSPAQSVIRLGLPAVEVEVSAAAAVLIDQERAFLRSETSPVTEPVDVTLRADGPAHIGSVVDLDLPGGWDLAVRCVGRRTLQVSVSPPPNPAKGRAAPPPPAQASVTCAVPAQWLCSGLSRSTGAVTFDGNSVVPSGQTWTLRGEPNRPLSVVLTLPESAATNPVLIAFQGLATQSLDVVDSGGDSSPRGDSNLLAGHVRFPGLDLPPADLRYREFLVASGMSGRVLQVCWTPESREPRATEPETLRPHLVTLWEGRATDLRAGHPGGGRSLMPSALVYLLGDREVVFVVTVAVYSLLVLVSLMHRKAPDPGGMIAGR